MAKEKVEKQGLEALLADLEKKNKLEKADVGDLKIVSSGSYLTYKYSSPEVAGEIYIGGIKTSPCVL